MNAEQRENYDHIFAYQKQQAEVVPIDDNMQTLIRMITSLSGLATYACCGGHENPSPIQRPAGEWLVGFEVYRCDEQGWDDLELVRYAMRKFPEDALNLEFSSTSSFHLCGKGIKPSTFAAELQREITARQRWYKK